jgi:ABC-type multidrug transport system fused ATPase/permease subunit
MRFIQLYSELINILPIIATVILLVLLKDSITTTEAGFSIVLISYLTNSISLFCFNFISIQSSMFSVQRLLDYSDIKPEGKYENLTGFKVSEGSLKFVDVCMRYRPDCQLSLKNISFEVKGIKVGIVGRTGAGKSSIIQVLFRIVDPESGTIFIDGVDYLTLGLHELRKQMSVIPQSPFIFIASVRENLDPFNEYTDEQILNVFEQVGLKNVILDTSEGLNTVLGGSELNLSNGQKQLLCVARILLRNNRIIVMDEATASIDNESDAIIQKLLNSVLKGCSFLVIAHKLRTVIDSDLVIVMDQGCCKEIGTPKELINQDSLLKKLILATGEKESDFLIDQIK